MKKLLSLSVLLISSMLLVSYINYSQVEIRPYVDADKDVVMEICFQDSLQFFCGSHIVKAGLMSAELFESENKKGMEAILNDSLRRKKVLIDSGKVVGFVEFFKTKEMSLEVLKQRMESQGLPFDEGQISAAMPYLKKTDAECEEFVEIESLAVEKSFRRKGYARALLKDVESTIKQLWPSIKIIHLDVNEHNQAAKNFYESEGFEVSSNQPLHLVAMKSVKYGKTL